MFVFLFLFISSFVAALHIEYRKIPYGNCEDWGGVFLTNQASCHVALEAGIHGIPESVTGVQVDAVWQGYEPQGCYYDLSNPDFVFFSRDGNNPNNMGSLKQICLFIEPDYHLLDDPVMEEQVTCQMKNLDVVSDQSECEEAAAFLGLDFSPFSDAILTNNPNRPEGCYWHNHGSFNIPKLWLAIQGTSGSLPSAGTLQICKDKPLPTDYVMLEDGINCEGFTCDCFDQGLLVVSNKVECEKAAGELELQNVPYAHQLHSAAVNVPEGCFWQQLAAGNNLFNLFHAPSGTQGSSAYYKQICKSQPAFHFFDWAPTCWAQQDTYYPTQSCDPSSPGTDNCYATGIRYFNGQYKPKSVINGNQCELGCCMGVCGGPCENGEDADPVPPKNQCWMMTATGWGGQGNSFGMRIVSECDDHNLWSGHPDYSIMQNEAYRCFGGPANALGWPAVEGQNNVFDQFECASGKCVDGECLQ